jgi:hypothetical protein
VQRINKERNMSTIFNFTTDHNLPQLHPTSWVAACFARLVESIDQRTMREREAYLAEATDIYDLEKRMRDNGQGGNPFFH